jgi:hypothetical protein
MLSVDLISLRFGACASLVVADCCLPPPPVIGAGCRKVLGKDNSTVDDAMVGGCGTATTKIVRLSESQVINNVVQNGLRTLRHVKDLRTKS